MTSNNGDSSSSRQERLDEILADLMRAVDAGESIDSDDWLSRNPDFEKELREFFEQNERVEKLVRPLRHLASHALHVRCPHCQNPIELLDEAPLTDLSCPSCGSRFNLLSEKTVSHFGPGEKTMGHFELLDRVGVGQFGSVWKARDTKLDRTVALKIPRQAQLDGSQAELFLRDARAAAQLKHPNIVGVHEVGKHDDTIYIVSDFIHGATLKEWLAAKSLTPREAAELCIKIAKALHHAHEAGVIHRDLKPGNIMVDAAGEPHIVDFGLAKRDTGEITMTVEGQILGTPAYMSPEQARGEGHTVDRRADIYSLGVILFELLTGELPFRGDKQMLIVQILNDDPPSPRTLNSSAPRDLETICLKCLEKDPNQRFYLTALDLAEDLERAVEHEPIRARPVHSVVRGARWVQKHPAAGGLVATSVLVITLIVALMTRGFYSDRLQLANRDLGSTVEKLNDALELAAAEKNESERQRQRAEDSEKEATEFMYSAHVVLAAQALDLGDAKHAYELLNPFRRGDSDPRGPEWYRIWRQIRADDCSFPAPVNIETLAYSRHGDWLLSGSSDGQLVVWDLSAQVRVHERKHSSGIRYATFLPSSGELVFSDVSGDVYKSQPSLEEMIPIADRPPEISEWLWTRISQPAENQESQSGTDRVTVRQVFSINGRHRSVATTTTQDSVNRTRTKCEVVVESTPDTSDGRQLTADIPEVGIGTRRFEVKGEVQSIAIAPSGRYVAVGGILRQSEGPSGIFVKLIDLDRENSSVDYECGSGLRVGSLAFRYDGNQLAGTVDDEIKVWDLKSVVNVKIEDASARCTLGVDTNGQYLATIHSQPTRIVLRDPTSGQEQRELLSDLGEIFDVSFDPTSELIAAAGVTGGVELWKCNTGERIHSFEGKERYYYSGYRVRFHPVQKLVASSGQRGFTVWDLKTKETVFRHQHQEKKYPDHHAGLAFSPSGDQIALGTRLSGVKVFSTSDWRLIRQIRTGFCLISLAYTPAGDQLVGVGHDAHIWFWDSRTGQRVKELPAKSKTIYDLAFTGSGKRLVSAHDDLTTVVWNMTTNSQLITVRHRELPHRGGGICTVAASKTGSVVAANANGQVNVW